MPPPTASDTQDLISKWSTGGQQRCHDTLSPYVATASDQASQDVLTDSFYVLLSSAMPSLSPSATLPSTTLASFTQSLIQAAPSTSSSEAALYENTSVSLVGDVLVDVIWTIDVELDDLAQDTNISVKEDKTALAHILKALLSTSTLRPSVCRERLAYPLLAAAGLIDEPVLTSKTPRVRTAQLYKQKKFNLLRETNEGYSKLIAEVQSLVGPAHAPSTGRPTESRQSLRKRAASTWETIVGFIGYFDLDPNRVLDIILDVFATHIISYHSFFLELVRCSGWSRKRLGAGEVSVDDVMTVDTPAVVYTGLAFQDVLEAAERAAGATKSQIDQEAPIVSDILGFKFAHYQHPDSSSLAPIDLYCMTALLIREGYIELADIYDHFGRGAISNFVTNSQLTPLDANMEAVKIKALEDADNKLKAPQKRNALADAKPLETSYRDRGPEPAKSDKSDLKKKPTPTGPKDPPNQKLGLVRFLLSLGALRPAFSILSRFPWMVQAYPDVAGLVLRIMKVAIDPLTDSILSTSPLMKFAESNGTARLRFLSRTQTSTYRGKPTLVTIAPLPVDSATQHNVFFYPGWPAFVPRCTSLDDLVDVLQPLMHLCGVQIHRDVEFVGRLSRLGKKALSQISERSADQSSMTEEQDTRIRQMWSDLARLYLLPSLSLVSVNPVNSMELWNLVSFFPPTERWAFYEQWEKYYQSKAPYPALFTQGRETARETKDILRRLNSNTTGRMFSQPISRMSYSNPLKVFGHALTQATSYSNFPAHIADALEYLTPLGFDVLTYEVLKFLAGPRGHLKDDGTSLQDWIQNLGSFVGKMLRRHRLMDPELFLEFIVHRLRANSSKEVLVLKEIIGTMTSIEPLVDLNDQQVLAFGGGPLLCLEVISQSTRGSRSAGVRKDNLEGMGRLKRSLMNGQKLALPLLVVLAQYRATCSYRVKTDEMHPKYLSSLFDESHAVLYQYTDFLCTALQQEQYASLVPSLADLCLKYGLEPAIAFHVLRPVYDKAVTSWNVTMHAEKKMADMKEKARASRAKLEASTSVVSGETVATPEASTTPLPPPVLELWAPALAPLIEDASRVLPAKTLQIMGPHFFVTFWQMTLQDISSPLPLYETTLKNLDAYFKEPMTDATSVERHIRADNRKLSEEAKKGLTAEMRQSLNAHEAGLNRLVREKSEWFKHTMDSLDSPSFSPLQLMGEIVQHCIHPRLLLSPMDAEFCARMIKLLHRAGTPAFSTASCYDRVLGDQLSAIISSTSDKEIVNYGRFLRVVLQDLDGWYSSEEQYKSFNRPNPNGPILPGFIRRINLLSRNVVVTEDDVMSHTDLCFLISKLHRKIKQNITMCLSSNTDRSVKNAFRVLNDILPVFPLKRINAVLPNRAGGPASYYMIGLQLENAVKAFLDDKRPDVKTLATGYHNKLLARRELWAPDLPKAAEEAENSALAPSKAELLATAGHRTEQRAEALAPTAVNGLPARPSLVTRASDVGKPGATNGTPAVALLPQNPSIPRHIPQTNNAPSKALSPAPVTPRPVERPEVIKRINRVEAKPESRPETPERAADKDPVKADDKQSNGTTSLNAASRVAEVPANDVKALSSSGSLHPSLPEKPGRPTSPTPMARQADSRRDPPASPRSHRRPEDDASVTRSTQAMPPPSAPSNKVTAQELRSTGRNAGPTRDRAEDRTPRSPRRRSQSPRPGTRNHSADSRTSGRGTRSDRSDGRDREDRSSRKPSDRDSKYDPPRERITGDASSGSRRGEQQRTREEDRDRDRRPTEREREKDRERERDRDRDRDRESRRERERDTERERERDRDKSGRERDRGDRRREKDAPAKRDRERDLPIGPSSSRRRDDDRTSSRTEGPGRDDPPRSASIVDDNGSHKRRREEEVGTSTATPSNRQAQVSATQETGPSKRLRENSNGDRVIQSQSNGATEGQSRRDDRDIKRPADHYSPNGRDRYRSEEERDRERERDAREGSRRPRADANGSGRGEENRAGPSVKDDQRGAPGGRDRDAPQPRENRELKRGENQAGDREKDRDRDRDSRARDKPKDERDSDRWDEGRKDDNSRREPTRETDRGKERDENKDRGQDPNSRRDQMSREGPGRPADPRDAATDAKPQPPTIRREVDTSSGVVTPLPPSAPSGPRAMTNSSQGMSIRGGAMKSDNLNGPSSTPQPRAVRSSLLHRIAPELVLRPPPPRPNGGGAGEVAISPSGREQESPTFGLPSKRPGVEAPTEPNGRVKRVRLNRNNAQ
ncbi:THO complex subunit 2 [Tulasnella sp. 332]|nr:THO complex subunit 2 [Tulasnella sp. 332]